MPGSVKLIYITTPDAETAEVLGRSLLEKHLAACINILPQMNSLYWWQEKIESSREAVLIAKTDSTRVSALIHEVESQHPYDVPCALTLNVESGSEAYLNWLRTTR